VSPAGRRPSAAAPVAVRRSRPAPRRLSHARLPQLTEDQVTVAGITGRERPAALKASVGYRDGFLAHGEISYAGPNALARAREAARIVEERLTLTRIPVTDARYDLIGLNEVHRGAGVGVGVGTVPPAEPAEIRLRVAARTDTLDHARRIGRDVASLWPNGPYGGAGVTRENIAIT